MRWLWIDTIERFESRRFAASKKTVSFAEEHLHHLHPDFPHMPPSLMIEGLAQTGGLLVGEANDFREKVVLAKIGHARFDDIAVPGDVLTYEIELAQLQDEGAICEGKIFKNATPLAEVQLVFAHVDHAKGLDAQAGDNFVFTKDHLVSLWRMSMMNIAARGQTQADGSADGQDGRPSAGSNHQPESTAP